MVGPLLPRQHRLCRVGLANEAERVPRLVDLSDSGPLLIGADSRLCSATDNPGLTQRWALALWRHPARPDGLFYRARHDPTCLSIALFDRADHLVVADGAANLLANLDQLLAILRRYQVGLIP